MGSMLCDYRLLLVYVHVMNLYCNKMALLFHENSNFDTVKEKIERNSTIHLLEGQRTVLLPVNWHE